MSEQSENLTQLEEQAQEPSAMLDRRSLLKVAGVGAAAAGAMSFAGPGFAVAQDGAGGDGTGERGPDNWYTSDRVTKDRVAFDNHYTMEVVGTLVRPKGRHRRRLPAIVIGHPMGAVKEQSSTLYATKLAEQGFVTLAIDQSFWGESEGQPRQAVLPDVFAEAFMASVDFLGTREFVDRKRIGVLGICGSGSFVVSAAKLDPRMRAVATVSMYDMGAASRNGLNHAQSLAQRKQTLMNAAEQRYTEFLGGRTPWGSGTPLAIDENSTPIEKEFYLEFKGSVQHS